MGYDGASVFVDMRNSSQVILPTAPAVSNEGGSSPLLALAPAVSWPWVPAWGSLEPSGRDGENAQKMRKNGAKMGEIEPKKCGRSGANQGSTGRRNGRPRSERRHKRGPRRKQRLWRTRRSCASLRTRSRRLDRRPWLPRRLRCGRHPTVASIRLITFRARACEAPSAGVGFVFERPNFERPGYERCQRLRGDPLSRSASPPEHGADTLSAGRLVRVASRPPRRRQAASSASCRICSGR